MSKQPGLQIVGAILLAVNTAASQSSAANTNKAAPIPRTENITLVVRDVQTGYSVPATVSYGPMEGDFSLPFTASADNEGRIRLTLPLGTYLFEMCAPGYQPMRAYEPVSAGGLTFEMDPTTPPEETRSEVLDAQLRPHYAMVFGYVVEELTGKPINNVRVYLQEGHAETLTNARGYYALFAKVRPPEQGPSSLPPTDTLVAEISGYTTLIYHRLPLYVIVLDGCRTTQSRRSPKSLCQTRTRIRSRPNCCSGSVVQHVHVTDEKRAI